MAQEGRKVRARARLLSGLLQTPPDELGEFRRERLAGAAGVTDERLRAVAEVLEKLCEAIEEGDDALWTRVRYARDGLWEPASPVSKEPEPRRDEPAPAPAPPIAPPVAPLPMAPRISPAPAAPSPWAPPSSPGAAPSSSPPSGPPAPVAPPLMLPTPPAAAPRVAMLGMLPELSGTVMATSPSMAGTPLPFAGKAAAPKPAMSSLEPIASFGQTAPAHGRASSGAPLPFGDEPEPSMGLEHYAWLAAQCATHPDHIGDLRAGYGMDEASHRELELAWQARFDRDLSLQQRWLKLFAEYKKQLSNR